MEAFELRPLRSATVLSLVFAAFSSFRLVVRKRTISSWPVLRPKRSAFRNGRFLSARQLVRSRRWPRPARPCLRSRRLYNALVSDGKVAMARSIVDRLRELFRFGATLLEDGECSRLFEALGKLRLENSPPRTVEMTAEHANAIRKTAREHFGWYSIALAQALQFELLLNEKT